MGKRGDGYHDICTLFHTITLSDTVELSRSQQPYSILRSDNPMLPFGKRNLCIKAYESVRENTGMEQTVEIQLKKNIPLGSGLGGGSSNAACVIKGVNELFELGLTPERMGDMGLHVGTDVPFFIYGGAAVGRGRGGRITPMSTFPEPVWLTLIKPRMSVSTGNAYKWVKAYRGKRELDDAELSKKLGEGDLEYIFGLMFNAFEPIVLAKYTELARYPKELKEAGCIKVQMTGCGSSFYGFCENEKQARSVADAFQDREDVVLAGAYHTV